MLEEVTLLTFVLLVFISCITTLCSQTRVEIERERSFKTSVIKRSNSELGSVTVLGAILLFSLAAASIYFCKTAELKYSKIRDRSHTYLCTHSYINSLESYLKKMDTFNKLIEAAYYAKTLAPTNKELEIAFRGLQLTQLGIHLNYQRKIPRSKWCNKKQTSALLLSSPYLYPTLQTLKRGLKGVALKRKTKWKVILVGRHLTLIGDFKLRAGSLAKKIQEVPHWAASFGELRS